MQLRGLKCDILSEAMQPYLLTDRQTANFVHDIELIICLPIIAIFVDGSARNAHVDETHERRKNTNITLN